VSGFQVDVSLICLPDSSIIVFVAAKLNPVYLLKSDT